MNVRKDKSKQIYVMETTATDTKNMEFIIKSMVDIVEKTVSKANIQASVWPGVMDHHAGRAHVGAVALGGKVHSLSEPDLSRRVVTMVDANLRA